MTRLRGASCLTSERDNLKGQERPLHSLTSGLPQIRIQLLRLSWQEFIQRNRQVFAPQLFLIEDEDFSVGAEEDGRRVFLDTIVDIGQVLDTVVSGFRQG